ncbi:MAG TPA: hypothetical protein VHE80_06155 [Acidimicrobiales bacterium]|nr:hypothetical protein [Acidimicrobiales bacterium]
MLVRQVHPGPGAPPYRSEEQKAADATAYRRLEEIPWTVLVDDVEGTVHRTYGGLTNPAYLIGTDGRVSFYAPSAGAPALHRALARLVTRGGRGVVRSGIDRVPHLLPALTEGWRAIERGLPQSAAELQAAAPGAVALLRIGRRARPLIGRFTLRAWPVPGGPQLGLAVAAALVLGREARRRRRRRY